MGINDEINRIAGKIEEAKAKITEKGGQTSSSSVNDLPQEIASIPTGGVLEILNLGRLEPNQTITISDEIWTKIKNAPTNYILSFIGGPSESYINYVYCVSSQESLFIYYNILGSSSVVQSLYMLVISSRTPAASLYLMQLPGIFYSSSYPDKSLLQWEQGVWTIKESNGLSSEQRFRTMAVGSELPSNINDIPQGALYGVY